jgi:hypothetical protein
MKRFLTIVAATAAAAAVAAAISLPAGASDEPTTKDAKQVLCLRDHGLAIPADTTGDAIKTWLLAHDGVDAAVDACRPHDAGNDVKVTELTACLRAHGLNPPADIEQLKPWIAEHADEAILNACGLDLPRKEDHGDKPAGPCGGPEPADKPAAASRSRS